MVLVGILVILISIFLPYVSMVQEANRRTRCAENLRTIGLALTEYTKTNSFAYPRVRAAVVPVAAPATAPAATQPATTNPVTLGPEALAPSAIPAPSPPATSPSMLTAGPAAATTAPTSAPAVPAPPAAPPRPPPSAAPCRKS